LRTGIEEADLKRGLLRAPLAAMRLRRRQEAW
jgi:hypothetical protein